MASLVDRIDRLASKSANKSSYTDNWLGNSGGYIPSGDLARDDYGVAVAYTVIPEIMASLGVWENFLDGVTWIIKDYATGQEIGRSDQRVYDIHERGGLWFNIVKGFEKRYFHSYFKSIAFSDHLFGETYLALLEASQQYRPNSTNYAGLKWLNPLNTEPMIMNGIIQYFSYMGMDTDMSHQIAPSAMAYRIMHRNAFDDLRGLSKIVSVLDDVNLKRNIIRAFKSFFAQGMILGGTIMPTGDNKLGDREHVIVKRELEANHKGTGNAGRWMVLPQALDVTPFGQEDSSRNYSVVKELKNSIFMAMGVPPQLAGDPSNATYDNAKDIKRQWWETMAIPYAKDIAGFHNNVILPKLEPDSRIYLEADTSAYEVEDPEVISQDVTAGYIDIVTAQAKRGYVANDKLKGVYLINGVPMHEDMIAELSRRVPSQYALDYAQAQAAGQAPSSNADIAASTVSPIESPASPTEIMRNYLTSEKKSVESLPTLDDGTPIVEAPLPATLNSAHDGIPDDVYHSHGLKHDVVSMIIDHSQLDPLAELNAWRKFIQNGKSTKRPFEAKALRGDLGDVLQLAIDSHDKQTILDAFLSAEKQLSVKAIQETRLTFENDFDTLLGRARTEKMTRQSWASSMRAIIRRYGYKAYVDGMSDGGVEDEPSEDDLITINSLSASNSGYVSELGNALYKSDTELSDASADVKAAMWYNKTINGFYEAGLLSADANGIYEWVYGKTESHCISCKTLNGQRHRLRRWKARIMPKSSELDCEGFLCDCNLIKVRGRERGNYLS